MPTTLSAPAVALVTAAGGVVTTITGRRQPRSRGAERRDDFTAVTDRLSQHIERLEREAEQDRQRITARDSPRGTSRGGRGRWWRTCVRQMEPPPPPQPVPDEVRPYLHDIGS